ncbi:MAG: tRNA (adenosine(37)-N6)-dimethylallyltransferase MiaA [Candidatus Paceibacteria bacterium]
MKYTKPPAVAIVGPTASGKTALSIELAKAFAGEVISADSRQVYRGMDIGTAKVTKEEMQGIPHHLLDVCDPHDVYTAMDFVRDANKALGDITNKNKLPIIAGGTFFYLDMLMGKMSAPEVAPDPALRTELESLSNKELLEKLKSLDPLRAEKIDVDNPRRLVRAIEIATVLGNVPVSAPQESQYRWLTLGIDIPLSILEERIRLRVMTRLEDGMIEEVEKLHAEGISYERLEAFGLEYRYIGRYLQGKIDRQEMIDELVTKTRQFAKRQKTWLKRDKSINWLPFPVDTKMALEQVQNFLEEK